MVGIELSQTLVWTAKKGEEKQSHRKPVQVEQMEAKSSRRSLPARDDKLDGNPKPLVSIHCTLPRAGNSNPSHPKKFAHPEKIALHTKPSYPPPVFPKQCVLPRDGSLLEKSTQFAGRVSQLEDEYQRMLDFVRDNVKKQVKVARLKENVPHNRYLDIGLLLVKLVYLIPYEND